MAEKVTLLEVFTELLEIGRSSTNPADYQAMRGRAESEIYRFKESWASDPRGAQQFARLQNRLKDAMPGATPSERIVFQHALHHIASEAQ
jgi:hypothetical protein